MCILSMMITGFLSSSAASETIVSESTRNIIATTVATSTVLSGIVYADLSANKTTVGLVATCDGPHNVAFSYANLAPDDSCPQNATDAFNLGDRLSGSSPVTAYQPPSVTEEGTANL